MRGCYHLEAGDFLPLSGSVRTRKSFNQRQCPHRAPARFRHERCRFEPVQPGGHLLDLGVFCVGSLKALGDYLHRNPQQVTSFHARHVVWVVVHETRQHHIQFVLQRCNTGSAVPTTSHANTYQERRRALALVRRSFVSRRRFLVVSRVCIDSRVALPSSLSPARLSNTPRAEEVCHIQPGCGWVLVGIPVHIHL